MFVLISSLLSCLSSPVVEAQTATLSAQKWSLRRVRVAHALIWAEADVQHRTLGMLAPGQLVLVGDTQVSAQWRDQTVNLVPARAQGQEGWMILDESAAVSLPVWGTSLEGPLNPFETTERPCEAKAPQPWAGAELKIIRMEGKSDAVYEAGCIETKDDGSQVAATRQGSASILGFASTKEERGCLERLAETGSTSEALKAAWPQEATLCDVLKVEKVDPPFPQSKTTFRIDLPQGEHAVEGFVVDGVWLQTSKVDGKRIFDGPDYVLYAIQRPGRFEVLRLGWAPASVLSVLDKPITGDGAEAFSVGRGGALNGKEGSCTWMPGRKQYYVCR